MRYTGTHSDRLIPRSGNKKTSLLSSFTMCLRSAGKIARFFLVFINILFMIFGLALLIVGIIMKVELVETDEIIATFNEVNLGGSLYLGNLLHALSILCICLGIFILIVAAVGAFGACMEKRCLLIIYAIIVGVILTAQIVCTALWFTLNADIKEGFRSELESALANYEGIHSTNDASIGWDHLFLGLECCGVDAVSASNDAEFQNSKWYANRADTNNKVPESCCKGANKKNYKSRGADAACQQALTDHYAEGCYDAFLSTLDELKIPIIIFSVVLVVIEIIGFAFAIVLCKAIKEKNMII